MKINYRMDKAYKKAKNALQTRIRRLRVISRYVVQICVIFIQSTRYIVFALLLCTLVAFSLIVFCQEEIIIYRSGVLLQLVGILISVIGVGKFILYWWHSLPNIPSFGPHHLRADGISLGAPILGKPFLFQWASQISSLEDRVNIIENNLKMLIDIIANADCQSNSNAQALQHRVDDITEQFERQLREMRAHFIAEMFKKTSHAKHLAIAGAILVVFGIFLSTFSVELSAWMQNQDVNPLFRLLQ